MAVQKLGSMRYKSFTWEYNPASCTYSCQRSYVAHKYPELVGVELEDIGTNEIIITGRGEFFGPNAYANWLRLNAEFKTHGSGTFYHPIFTDITHALMTKLQAELEPREDYVAYSFEIISDNTPIFNATPSTNIPSSSSGSNTIKIGDTVILTGYAYYDSYGSTPRSSYKDGVKYVVTYVNYKGTHPIHCGTLGWCRLQDIKKMAIVSAVTQPIAELIIHIVKSGDTLSKICSRYGANWKKIAEYNGIKNPNLIFVGDKIKIPKSMTSSATINSSASGTKNITQSSSSKISGGSNIRIQHVIN